VPFLASMVAVRVCAAPVAPDGDLHLAADGSFAHQAGDLLDALDGGAIVLEHDIAFLDARPGGGLSLATLSEPRTALRAPLSS